jgi:hypothetical protein
LGPYFDHAVSATYQRHAMLKTQRLLVFVALLGMLATSPAFGSSKRKALPLPRTQFPSIASVTPISITISEAKATKTYTITQFTEINVNGVKATAAELKPGMTVSIVISTDSTKVSRINATGK